MVQLLPARVWGGGMLACVGLFRPAPQVLSLSSGGADDRDRNEARSAPTHTRRSGPELEDGEDDVAEADRGQARRKVTVRSVT